MGESGVQFAGQTSPCVSTYWNAFTKRSVSSTLRPTGRSLMLKCLIIPLGSMIKRPLQRNRSRTCYLEHLVKFQISQSTFHRKVFSVFKSASTLHADYHHIPLLGRQQLWAYGIWIYDINNFKWIWGKIISSVLESSVWALSLSTVGCDLNPLLLL